MSEAPPPAQAGRRAQSELASRVASGVVLGFVALSSAYAGGPVFALVWAAAAAAVAHEWIHIVSPGAPPALRVAAPTGMLVAGLSVHFLPGHATWAVLALTLLAALTLARPPWSRTWAAAGVLYAAVLAFVPITLRNTPQIGLGGILWMFAVVWATDIAGYFAGRRFGGPKLWPRVSPNKTWSGFIGGTLAGAAAGYLVSLTFWENLNSVKVVVAGAVVSAAGQAGDLGESALKRHFGVKDSSNLIPGHGGFMDRLDGFWAASLIVGLALAVRAA